MLLGNSLTNLLLHVNLFLCPIIQSRIPFYAIFPADVGLLQFNLQILLLKLVDHMNLRKQHNCNLKCAFDEVGEMLAKQCQSNLRQGHTKRQERRMRQCNWEFGDLTALYNSFVATSLFTSPRIPRVHHCSIAQSLNNIACDRNTTTNRMKKSFLEMESEWNCDGPNSILERALVINLIESSFVRTLRSAIIAGHFSLQLKIPTRFNQAKTSWLEDIVTESDQQNGNIRNAKEENELIKDSTDLQSTLLHFSGESTHESSFAGAKISGLNPLHLLLANDWETAFVFTIDKQFDILKEYDRKKQNIGEHTFTKFAIMLSVQYLEFC